MSNEPSAEDKARYEAIRKELMQALPKKRAVDKQLVCLLYLLRTTKLIFLTGAYRSPDIQL
jgi:chromatin modification-related protein EAF6